MSNNSNEKPRLHLQRRAPRPWPRAFYGGELTYCRWSKAAQFFFTGRAEGAWWDGGRTRDAMAREIEALTGLAIHERWQVRPFNCGDYSCVNHHHWRVTRVANSEAPELPRHPGYLQLGADEIEEIKRIIANRRDQDEPVRIIHRSNPERMYEFIEQAQLELLKDCGDTKI